MPKPAAIDPRSDATLLAYTDGALPAGVPGRDLSGNDLARIARVWALTASGGQPVDPAGPDMLAAVREALLASGSFVPSPPGSPDQTPAEPAVPEA